MNKIEIKFEKTEVIEKYVNYSEILELIRKEDEELTRIWRMNKEKNKILANNCLQKAVEADYIRKKIITEFGE